VTPLDCAAGWNPDGKVASDSGYRLWRRPPLTGELASAICILSEGLTGAVNRVTKDFVLGEYVL
jgi:hypothetical protein